MGGPFLSPLTSLLILINLRGVDPNSLDAWNCFLEAYIKERIPLAIRNDGLDMWNQSISKFSLVWPIFKVLNS